MTEKRKITFFDPNDSTKTQVCDILVEFRSSVTKKHYVLFTPYTPNSSKDREVQACVIDRTFFPPKVEQISTDFEWEMMEHVFSEYIQRSMESEEPV